MVEILKKELNMFFSSLTAYIVIGVFLVVMGLFMWVFPEYSVLEYCYATMEQLFSMAPWIFVFLVPAITMRSLAEETQTGTIEFLVTKPVKLFHIILGKYLACVLLIAFALLPTLLYYYTIYELGSPKGNLDSGAIWGSYLGLFLLGSVYASIGLFASSLTNNQIVAFMLAAFLCFFCHWGFYYVSSLPIFLGSSDDIIQMLGIDYHYNSISRGVIDTRDIIYFLSFIALFLGLTHWRMSKND
ncbi:MAG: ABC-2 type transport system permease protein [Maribacter sp.]|jgi:ABC-2 type transport system permease protein